MTDQSTFHQRRRVLAAGASLLLAPVASALAATASATASARKITVAADGSGDFKTVQEAFSAVPDNSAEATIIHIKPGVYSGQKLLGANKHKVTLQGADAATTILTYDQNAQEPSPFYAGHKGTGLIVLGNDFRADQLTFQNTSGDHGQALALRIDGDRAAVTNSRLLGWQDTVMLNKGRQYFRNCYIEGRVDFIYGSGTAVFEQCEIKSKNGGYITAASTPPERPYGFVFIDCRLTGDPAPWIDPTGVIPPKPQTKVPQAYLGRPWRPHGAVAFINCEMGEHIKPEGWHNWGKVDNEATARYVEYGSKGPGGDTGKRVAWSRQLSRDEAARYTATAILATPDNWKP